MDDLIIETTHKQNCKGLFYRGIVNKFINAKGHIVFKQELKPLKRMSCRGCPECGYLVEQVNEFLYEDCLILPDIKNGAVYRPRITNISRDFETGMIDDWEIEFVIVQNNC